MHRRTKKRFLSEDSDHERTFSHRKKSRYTKEAEHDSPIYVKKFADKTRSKLRTNVNHSHEPPKRAKHILNPGPPYPEFSDFSGLFPPESRPEKAQPEWSNNPMESNKFFVYKSGPFSVDSDGDVLMTDAGGEEILIDLDSCLSKLEFARKSWEYEVKQFQAKVEQNLCRLDTLTTLLSLGKGTAIKGRSRDG